VNPPSGLFGNKVRFTWEARVTGLARGTALAEVTLCRTSVPGKARKEVCSLSRR
jgi:hypothetical protein